MSDADENEKIHATFYCPWCGYDDRVEFDIEIPEGWTFHGEWEEERDALCAKHAAIDLFRQEQCPGCVASWGDCGMWELFAYEGRRDIGASDFEALEQGVCPRRVNGTMFVNNTPGQPVEIRSVDLSSPAVLGGRAFAAAIRGWIERYPARV